MASGVGEGVGTRSAVQALGLTKRVDVLALGAVDTGGGTERRIVDGDESSVIRKGDLDAVPTARALKAVRKRGVVGKATGVAGNAAGLTERCVRHTTGAVEAGSGSSDGDELTSRAREAHVRTRQPLVVTNGAG